MATLKSSFANGKIQLKQWDFSVPAVCVLMVMTDLTSHPAPCQELKSVVRNS